MSKLLFLAAVALVAASAASAVVAKPSITKFTPSTAKAGVTVTVTGAGFTGAKTVEVDGLKTTFKVISSTKLTLKVPAKAKNGKITVVTAGGKAISAAMLKI